MHKTKFTKPLKNLTCVSAVGRQTANSRPTALTHVKFLSVSLLLVKCQLTVGILPADSILTVGRQTFRGAVLHFYQNLKVSQDRAEGNIEI